MGDYVPLAPGVRPIGENRIAEQNHMITLAHRAGGCAVDRISFAFGYVFRPMGGGVGMPGVFVRDDSGHDDDCRSIGAMSIRAGVTTQLRQAHPP
jgi:hypothetical protein